MWWCATVLFFSSVCRSRSLVSAFTALCFLASLVYFLPLFPLSCTVTGCGCIRLPKLTQLHPSEVVYSSRRSGCSVFFLYSPVQVKLHFLEKPQIQCESRKRMFFFLLRSLFPLKETPPQKQNLLALRQTLLGLESVVSGPPLAAPFSQEKRRKHPASILTEAWNKLLGADVCIQAALLGQIPVCPQMSAHSQVTAGHLSSAQLAALALERKTTRVSMREPAGRLAACQSSTSSGE